MRHGNSVKRRKFRALECERRLVSVRESERLYTPADEMENRQDLMRWHLYIFDNSVTLIANQEVCEVTRELIGWL